MKRLLSATFSGFEAILVEAEGAFSRGLPGFSIVGLANNEIQESKERVKSALSSIGFNFPPLKVLVNLAPSDIEKNGTHFDLGIALLLYFQQNEGEFDNIFVFGELGLDGAIKDTPLIYPLILSLYNQGVLKSALVPKASAQKLSKIPNIAIYGIETLQNAIEFIKNKDAIAPFESSELESKFLELGGQKYYYAEDFAEDFFQVVGQAIAKRAALIASAGFHNILLEGSPGVGKSMIAKRMRYILPPLELNEILKIAKRISLDGSEPDFKPIRPFRAPHHTSTKSSIFGGGTKNASIGEVGLADSGICWFDELPHFSKPILEAMREPMEDNKIRISRVHSKIEYPAEFLFIGSQNPCPCGNLLSATKECRCTELELQRYKNRLSDPFLDRIDIYVQMQEGESDTHKINSKEMFDGVLKSFKAQKERGQNRLNGKLNEAQISQYCTLDSESSELLQSAVGRFGLSMRSVDKVKKVARTIADLESSDGIKKPHILEALSFRRR